MQFIPGFFLLVLSLLQPMHHLPWASWHSEILAFFAVLTLGWQYLLSTAHGNRQNGFKIPSAIVPLLILSVTVCVQSLFGLIVFRGDALTYLAYFSLAALALTLGFNASPERATPMLALTLVVAASISAFIMLAQSFEVWESFTWIDRAHNSRRSGGNIGQPNLLATLLIIGLASLMYLFESQKAGKLVTLVTTVLLLFALSATESRAGILSFVLLLALWLIYLRVMSSQLSLKLVLGGFLVFILFYFVWPWLFSEAYQLNTDSISRNQVAYNRWIIWPQLLETLWLSPWWGWGFGQISSAHNAVVHAYTRSEPYTYAHNIILDFALGLGLPLTILLLTIVAVWFRRRINGVRDSATWYCLAVSLPVAVHSMFEFPFAYAYFLLPIMFALGMLEKLQNRKPMWTAKLWQFTVGLAVATILLVLSVVEYVAIEEDFRIARFEALRVGQTASDYQRPNIYLLTQFDAMLSASRMVPRPDMPDEEIELSRVAALRFPWTALQNRYALALALNGNPDEAVRQLKVMRALHGEKHFARLRRAWIELAETKYPQLASIALP